MNGRLHSITRKTGSRGRLACACLAAGIISGCTPWVDMQQHDLDLKTNERGITEFTLANGMKVLVKEDHRAPVAIVQVWYRVGSNDEPSGLTGISHVLEHMMFKGTPEYPAEKFTQTIKREGGNYNAFTSSDYTAYYEAFEKSRMPISFAIESDRMVNIALREEDFEKEIEVVKEERRLRVGGKPESRLYEQLYATAFKTSPSGQPVIGWMNDLENMQLDDLKDWHSRWYVPNNALLMVAGDVDPREVYQLALRYMGPLKAAPLPERKPRKEPPQYGETRFTIKLPAKKHTLLHGYRVPTIGQADHAWEPYALTILSAALSGGSAARFARNLVRGKQLAGGANTHYGPYSVHEELFLISASPLKGVSVAELEAAIEEEIEMIKNEGIDDTELERIKTKVHSREIYSRDSLNHQAYRLASLEITGIGWQAAYDFFDALHQVTAEQVQAVAKKYLVKDQRTVAILDPQPVEQEPQPGHPPQ